MQSGKQSI